jgi:hypothetical protein
MDNLKPTATDPKLPIVSYNMSQVNPYKTLPKDVQSRRETRGSSESTRGYSGGQSFGERGNFRGRSNFGGGNRGGMSMGGGGFQRGGGSYQGGMGSLGGMPNMGGPPSIVMAGFNGMPVGFSNFNRGGMMGGGMRGGMHSRGGRGHVGGPGIIGHMSGGGIHMPNVPASMGGMNAMGMGGGMMGMPGKSIHGHPELSLLGDSLTRQIGGFQNQTHFNPAFFQGQSSGSDWSNPHGTKRPRAE